MANKQAVLGSGAIFTGKISNAKSIETTAATTQQIVNIRM